MWMDTGSGDFVLSFYRVLRMKELFLRIAFLSCVGTTLLSGRASAQSGTPSLVQYGSDMQWTFHMTSGQDTLVYLPNPSGAGNLITVCYGKNGGASTTVTDDKGNTYHLGDTVHDNTSNLDVVCYYAYNVAAGTHAIKVTANSSTDWSTPVVGEWTGVMNNADPLDVHTSGFATSATISAGSVTPNYSGDLAIQFAWDVRACCQTPNILWTAGTNSNIPWQLWVAENEMDAGAQWGVYNSTAAINPNIVNSGSTVGGATVAMFFRSGNGGTPQPGGIQVVGRKTLNINSAPPFNGSPHTVQAPCPAYANLMVVTYGGGAGYDLTGVSSNPANTWAQTHALVTGGNPTVHNYYAANATLSPTTTITLNVSPHSQNAGVYCIKGAAAAPFDVAATTVGNQTSCSGGNCNLDLVTVTPSTPNGLIIVTNSQNMNTSTGFVGANQDWDGCIYSGESLNVSGCSQNNVLGHYLNADTSPVNFTATQWSNSTPVQVYVAEADSFKSGTQTTSAPNPPTGLTASVQ